MRGSSLVLLAAALLTGLGCSHDLDKLRSASGGLRDSGTPNRLKGTSGGGGGGTAGGNTLSDGGMPSGTQAGACEPCMALTDAGAAIGLRSCCRGPTNGECGLTFGQGNLCLARMVPGQTNAVCPATRQGPADLQGCCRPDGRCGLLGTMLDLGCVARDEILPALGAPNAAPIACVYECKTDDDCSRVAGGFMCTEDPKDSSHMRRICVNDCLRDQDCLRGQVCTLGNDIAMDRILSFCQAPVGMAAVGEYCSAPKDCVHGICLQYQGMASFCTQLCRNNADCPMSRANCFLSSIATPSKAKTENFHVCGP